MTKRIFIALNLPAEVKKEIFERISRKIDRRKCKVVQEENLHVTMLFLGYLNEEAIKELEEKLAELKKEKSFEAVIEGIGEFNGRVIWVGVKEGEKEIELIHEKLCNVLEVKDERFNSHITIARVKELRKNEVQKLAEKLNEEKFSAKVRFDSVDLMESVLEKNGPKYFVLKKFEFSH